MRPLPVSSPEKRRERGRRKNGTLEIESADRREIWNNRRLLQHVRNSHVNSHESAERKNSADVEEDSKVVCGAGNSTGRHGDIFLP